MNMSEESEADPGEEAVHWRQQKFADFAVKEFDPSIVVNFVAMPANPIPGQKQVLFAGFRSWVVSPLDTGLIKASMVVAAAEALDQRERVLRKGRGSKNTQPADIRLRREKGPRAFIENVFEPLGGLRGVV